MRAILLVLILGVVALLIAIGTGLVNIRQVRPAAAPNLSTTGNGVNAKGGQAPAFDVQTGSVKVGVEEKKVKMPSISVQPADGNSSGNAL